MLSLIIQDQTRSNKKRPRHRELNLPLISPDLIFSPQNKCNRPLASSRNDPWYRTNDTKSVQMM